MAYQAGGISCPRCSFLRLGAVAGVPPAALQGGSLLRHLALAAILSLLLALVACSGSASAGPTATGATGPASAEPPTAVRAGQPQAQTDRPLALAPTGRTPIPALNTRQISATQQAQVSEIKTRHAPTSERVTPPPPLPAFPPPPAVAYPTFAPPTLVRTTHACGTNPRTTHARNESCPPGLWAPISSPRTEATA